MFLGKTLSFGYPNGLKIDQDIQQLSIGVGKYIFLSRRTAVVGYAPGVEEFLRL